MVRSPLLLVWKGVAVKLKRYANLHMQSLTFVKNAFKSRLHTGNIKTAKKQKVFRAL